MSSILCLYKFNNFIDESDNWALSNSPSYNSHQSRLHSVTNYGETAYIVTYIQGHCYLVGRIIITNKYFNNPDYEFGEFGVSGNRSQSQTYDSGLIDVTNILRQLTFKTGKCIGSSLQPISQHIQTIRELTEDDVALLESVIP